MKTLMTGDEAVAQGAWEAGVDFAAAYPGTPSTEIMENLAQYDRVYCEWSPNEKVALEGAIGASIAGGRALASMKHVGLNVAADPLFTFSYTGVNGGTVIVTADEPGQFSSQNEQDNRNYAKAARIPMLEPADSQECLDMTALAFDISETYDTPVLLRLTTRVCHSKSLVMTGPRREIPIKPYSRNGAKYVMVPANAKQRRLAVEERSARLGRYAEETPLNFAEYHQGNIGVVASGACYLYAKEVFGDSASYLKLGFTWPLPQDMLRSFCLKMDKIYVVEENDPYLEEALRLLGFDPIGKELFPFCGEMTPDVLRQALYGQTLPHAQSDQERVIPRPPALCAGCPHRGFFYEAGRRKNVMISGDIGCYTLGFAPPFQAMDATVCMGASISMGHGAQKIFSRGAEQTKVISVIGDSTFFHTGLNSLLNVVYNNGATVNVILDNRITGMTGHQQNPGSGYNVRQEPAPAIDIEGLVKALGIRQVRVIDPNDLAQVKAALDDFLPLDEPSVIITRWPCALKRFSPEDKEEFPAAFSGKYQVDAGKCIGCKLCLKAGCPALSYAPEQKKARLDRAQCLGCGVCAQLCAKGALIKEEK